MRLFVRFSVASSFVCSVRAVESSAARPASPMLPSVSESIALALPYKLTTKTAYDVLFWFFEKQNLIIIINLAHDINISVCFAMLECLAQCAIEFGSCRPRIP